MLHIRGYVFMYLISACGVGSTVGTRIISKLEDKNHQGFRLNMIEGCDAAVKPLGGAQPPKLSGFIT